MKVLITGGAGFIGSNFVEFWTKKNAEIIVVDNLRTGFEKNIEGFKNVQFFKKSITDREFIFQVTKGIDYIFNLAALVSVPESFEKEEETYDINVNGLKNLLDASVENNVKKLVHTSSAAVYGDSPEMPKIETMKAEPISPYGKTKYMGELLCNEYFEKYSFPAVSLRYFNVYGPRQNPYGAYASVIPIFALKALKNETITIFGDGEQTRDFVFVNDVVRANFLAAEKKEALGVFNVANGSTITINILAEKIKKITGSSSEIIYKPEREGDIKHSSASVLRAERELGFVSENDFDNGLAETIEYYKKEVKNL